MASTINASTTSTTGLVQTADASGILQLQSDGTTGLTVNANANVTVNTNLFVSGSGVQPLVSGTAQNTTSGTAIDFTGIPSWAKRITVMLTGVSTSGTSEVIVQLGTTSGFATSGYLGAASTNRDAVSPGVDPYSTGFLLRLGATSSTAAAVRHGVCTFMNVSGNTWVGQTIISLSNTVTVGGMGSGTIALAATLTQVRITTVNGTDTFDAGSINILYE